MERATPAAEVQRLTGHSMGTSWSASLVAPAAHAQALHTLIGAAFDHVVADMSAWEVRSALSRFNCAEAGAWHGLAPPLFEVLMAGITIAEASGGAFNPTIGALTDLWGFGAVPAERIPPSTASIARALAGSDWRRLEIDPATRRVRQPGDLRLDVNGIAKGFAVDLAAEALIASGCRDFLLELGGELRGQGVRPDRQPWWVMVEPPPALAIIETRIALHGLSIATSGDYRRFHADEAGRHLAHSIDPRTGWPVANDLASVTVVHPRCMLADGWATALMVAGESEGLRLADANGIAALFVARDRGAARETISPAMAAMLS